jgi:hypothetical protein
MLHGTKVRLTAAGRRHFANNMLRPPTDEECVGAVVGGYTYHHVALPVRANTSDGYWRFDDDEIELV